MRFWEKSLMARLVTYFLILSVVTVSVVAYVAYERSRDSLKEAAFDRLDAVATLKEDELERWVADLRGDVVLVAGLPGVRSEAEALLSYSESDPEYQAAYATLSEAMIDIVGRKPDFREILILSDVGGEVLLSSGKAHEGAYHSTDRYFTEGRLGIVVENVYTSPETFEPTMTIATPLLNDVGRQLGGVLAVHLNLDRMDRIILKDLALGDPIDTYLVDRTGTFVSGGGADEGQIAAAVNTEGVEAALKGQDGRGLYRNYDGVSVVGVYRWMDGQDMALLAEMRQSDAFEPARQLAMTIGIVGAISILVLALGVYLAARRISRPILAVTDAARQVAEGDLNAAAPIMTKDEVGSLARTFNQMTSRLRSAREELRESEERYRAIADTAQDSIFCKDMARKYTFVNPAMERLFGCPASQLLGRTPEDIFDEESAAIIAEVDIPVLAGKIVNEVRSLPINGVPHVFHTIQVPLRDANGNVSGISGIVRDITDRKEAAEDLRQSEERYRTLFEGAAEGILVAGLETKEFRYANPSICALLGYTEDELKTMSVLDIHPKEALEHVLGEFEAQARGDKILAEDLPCLRKDGSVIYVDISTVGLVIDGRECNVGFFTDITERKRAEDAIVRQRALLEGINRILREALTCETESEIAAACLAVAEELTGSRFGLVGEVNEAGRLDTIALSDPGWAECRMPKEDAARMITDMEIRGIWGQVVLKEETLIVNDPPSHPDRVGVPAGHPALSSFLGVPLKREGRTIGLIALANKDGGYEQSDQRDAEALSVAFVEALMRKRAEEALRESELKYATVVDRANDGVVVIQGGVYKYVNEAWSRTTGHSPDELMTMTIEDVVAPEHKALVRQRYEARVAGRTPPVYEVRIQHKDGTLLDVELSAAIIQWGGRPADVAVIRNITERKKVEQALRESEEKFRVLADQSLVGIAILTTEGVRYANNALSEMTGYPMEELTSWGPQEFARAIHPADVDLVMSHFERRLAGEPDLLSRYDYRIITKSGEPRWLSMHASLVELRGVPSTMVSLVDVTDRVDAEASLREREAYLGAVIDNLPFDFWAMDTEQRFTEQNAHCRENWGNLIGKRVQELQVPEDLKALWIDQNERALAGETSPLAYSIVSKGHERYFENAVAPVIVGDEITAVIGLAVEVTEREEAANALQHERDFAESLVSTAQAIILVLDPEGRIVRYNPFMEELSGYQLEEVWGKDWADTFVPEEYREWIRGLFVEREGREDVKGVVNPIVTKDGRELLIEWHGRALRGPEGLTGWVAIGQDITERTRTEEAVRAEKDLFEAIMDSLPGVFYLFDEDGKFERWNRNFGLVTGYADEEIAKMHPVDLFGEADGQRVAQASEEVFSTGEASVEADFLTKQGEEIPYYFVGKRLEIGGKPFLTGMGVDITDRKRAEWELRLYRDHLEELVGARTAELQSKNVELEHANIRLEEADRLKSIFLASMSHELRTPLNSIIGFTGILLKGMTGELNEEQKKQLSMVKNSGNHLLSLINDVLDVARIEAGRVEPSISEFRLDEVVGEVVDTFVPQTIEKGLSIRHEVPHDVVLENDRRRVKQVLINVVSNAVKFTEHGGVNVSAERLDDTVRITVADTGMGVKAEDMRKLFEPFQQVDAFLTKAHEGTGLGLYLSRKLANLIGGDVSATSEFGKGSEFTFTIPLRYQVPGVGDQGT